MLVYEVGGGLMPNIKSAKKRVTIGAKREKANVKVEGAMKNSIKKAAKTTDIKDINDAVKKVDKSLKKGIIKKNTAARKKASLMKKANQA